MKIGYIRVSTQEQNTIRQEVLITAAEAMRRLNMKPGTFYRKVKTADRDLLPHHGKSAIFIAYYKCITLGTFLLS